MNKLLPAILTSLMLFSFSAVIAQGVDCGTSTQTQYEARERLFQNRINAANQETASSRDVTVYAPIKFHLVAKSDGSFRATEIQIINLLCAINNYYADQEMIFYINYPFNYINNDALYDNPGSSAGLFQISQNWSNSSVNIFINGGTGDPGSGAYYIGNTPFANEHIILPKNILQGKAASHELGHFFSLPHPFLGWGQGGGTGWDPDEHGNPVGTWGPVGPPYILNEKMDGSNCLNAGDGICDTPPDYFFANSPEHGGGCSWSGGAMDPDGVLVVTMENNVMNYFGSCSEYLFTPDQKEAVRNDFNSSSRSYIRHTYVPPTEDITVTPELLEPIDGEITPGYNTINFDWEPSPNAQRYILEIDLQPTFSIIPHRFIIANGSSAEIEDIFSPNITYYWRVTPYNDGNTCNLPVSDIESFKAGESVSTKDIEIVNNWSVIPNPVRQNEFLTIQLEADEAFDAAIRLFNMTGQLVQSVNKTRFNIGENNYNLDISGINTGMYIIAVQSDQGVINRKIVITE